MRKVFLAVFAIIIVGVSVGRTPAQQGAGARPTAKRSAPRFGEVPEQQTASLRFRAPNTLEKPARLVAERLAAGKYQIGEAGVAHAETETGSVDAKWELSRGAGARRREIRGKDVFSNLPPVTCRTARLPGFRRWSQLATYRRESMIILQVGPFGLHQLKLGTFAT
ncbi:MULTISPECIES: hypothetical protein [unclassified Bradyrhizobium]